jgi:hypothetical protein
VYLDRQREFFWEGMSAQDRNNPKYSNAKNVNFNSLRLSRPARPQLDGRPLPNPAAVELTASISSPTLPNMAPSNITPNYDGASRNSRSQSITTHIGPGGKYAPSKSSSFQRNSLGGSRQKSNVKNLGFKFADKNDDPLKKRLSLTAISQDPEPFPSWQFEVIPSYLFRDNFPGISRSMRWRF